MPGLGGFPGNVPVKAVSAGFNVTPSYAGFLIDVTATGGAVTITTDAAATLAQGFTFFVRRNSASDSNVVINPNGAETIDGNATLTLTLSNEIVQIGCNGSVFLLLDTSTPAAGSITSGMIASGAIGWPHLASGAVRSGHVGNAAVVSGSIASGQIGANHLASGVLSNFSLSSGVVQSGHIGDAAVNSGNIASGSVGWPHIGSGAIRSGHIASGQIGANHLVSGLLSNFTLSSGVVQSGHVGDGAINSGNVASGCIGWPHLASGAVRSGHIGNAAVVSGSIASGAIGPLHLSSGGAPKAHAATHLDTGSDPLDFSLIIGKGADGDEPAATPANEGYLYVVDNLSDGNYLKRSNGSSWDVITAPVNELDAALLILPLTYQERDEKDQPSGYLGLNSSGLINSGYFTSGTIFWHHLTSGFIRSGHIGNGAVVSGSIASGQVSANHLASGVLSPGSSTRETITQASHGFAAGDVVYLNSSTWTKARADAVATAEAVGVVESADTNTFVIVYNGAITLSGLTAGSVYFLSDGTAGLLTTTEPTTVGYVSKPLLVAKTTTAGVVHNWRGVRIGNSAIGCPKWMAAMDYATGQSAMFPLVLAQHRSWFGA